MVGANCEPAHIGNMVRKIWTMQSTARRTKRVTEITATRRRCPILPLIQEGDETMATQEQRDKAKQRAKPDAPSSPDRATKSDKGNTRELSQEDLERVSGGEPPDPCRKLR